jgi:hypothetical protein
MAGRGGISTGALLVIAVGVGVVVWVALRPDAGEVDRERDAPEAPGVGPVQAVVGPTVTLTSSMGDSTGDPSGTVTAGSLLIDIDEDTLTATSLIDGESVWSYGREDKGIDGWTVSGDAVWVLFDDHLLVRVNVGAARVADSTVFDELYDGDDAPSLTGDGLGGLVLQGQPSESEPVWWVGSDLDPVPLDLPSECDAQSDASSDGDRIYLLASCADDSQRVAAFTTDGSTEWVYEPTSARSLEVDRGDVVVHGPDGSALLDPGTGEVAAEVPAPAPGYSYFSASDGLFAAWEPNAPPGRSGLVVWSSDGHRVVWRLPGLGEEGTVSAPLVSDGSLYYARTTYGEEPSFALEVVDVVSGETSSAELTNPGPTSCDDAPTEFRPQIHAGIPGGIVVSWQDESFCADPMLEVYTDAG